MVMDEVSFEEVFSKDKQLLLKEEYDRLRDICYLDHTGSALYSKTYIKTALNELMDNVYSNPHSGSLTGKHCSDSIDQIRYKILHHFNTDVDEYSVIFTSGATAALKLVAESFCWNTSEHYSDNEWFPKEENSNGNGGDFVYMEDNHTSVLGMRETVRQRGATVKCLQHNETIDIFLNEQYSYECDESPKINSLFVYSAQCNFSGVKYPLSWIEKVKNGILDNSCGKRANWYCLLDAATYISTNKLDLNKYKPDFVCISFYKLFGYPTGLGALLVRNTSANVLRKSYYGGGTVMIALSSEKYYVPRPLLHERFEDGTLNFLSIVALDKGFEVYNTLVGSMKNVSKHCFNLAKYLFYSLLQLHHGNGSPVVHLYADTPYDDINTQGNIVNFNLLRPNGDFVGYAEVLHMANLNGIQLRTGCFCNPGACRRHLGLTNQDLRKHYQAGHVCGDENDLVNGYPTGSVRVSFGHYSTKEDVDKLLNMIENCFILKPTMKRIPFLWDYIASILRNKFQNSNQKFKEIKPSDFIDYINQWNVYTENILSENAEKTDENEKVNMNEKNESNLDRKSIYLSHIFIYPVKSCGKFAVQKWQLTKKGLKYDRHWMIVNSSGVALTQKKEPKMCKIRPKIDLVSNKLHLTFEGYPDVSVDLENEYNKQFQSDVSFCQSKVCGDRVKAIDCGNEVALWLSTVLNRPGLRLIRQLPDDKRINKKSLGSLTLANQAQYLLVNLESVQWLSDQLENTDFCKESMLDRFRCNFAVSNIGAPFVEQDWTSVKIGSTNFKVDGACTRCQMICIDQDTAEYSKEPLTLLTSHFNGKLKFGIYLSRENKDENFEETTLSVGDVFCSFNI